MNIGCRLGLHKWKYPGDREYSTRYSKAGILAGSINLGKMTCSNCSKSHEVFKVFNMINMVIGKWERLDKLKPELQKAIFDDFLPLGELTEFTEFNNKRKKNQT